MGKFNLDKAADFTALTMSTAGGLLNAFNRDTKEWNIVEATYTSGKRGSKPVRFHIFQSVAENYQAALSTVRDRGGRRKVVITYPYVDGQTTDDLGRQGETFELEVLIHGVAYQNGMRLLLEALQFPVPGTLLHPVRGEVRCGLAPNGLELIHSHDTVNAVAIRLTLLEHNFDGAAFGKVIFGSNVSKFKSAIGTAIGVLNKVNQAIATVRALVNFATSLRTSIAQKIAEFQADLQGFIVDCNATFNNGSSIDIPGAVPTTSGGVVTPATGSTALTAGVGGVVTLPGGYVRVGTNFTTVVSNQDPLANVPTELLSDTAKQAIATKSLVNRNDVLRQEVIEIISDINSGAGGLGGVILSDTVLDMKRAVIAAQQLLEAGVQSSRSAIVSYPVPWLMSTREIAFHNGLDVNDAFQIELMNPELESVNYVPQGTIVLVPVLL